MTALKILHLSNTGIHDERIIKAANTGKKVGYEEYFCGINQVTNFTTDVFTKIKWINYPDRGRLAISLHPFLDKFWDWYPFPKQFNFLKKQIEDVVKEVKPDIIHSHNIFVAYPASKLGIPMVVDDHELYSVNIQARTENYTKFKKRIIAKIAKKRWEKWEHNLGENHPIITVSKKIADHHKKYCDNVFVVPNYPSENSIKPFNFQDVTSRNLCSTYFGTDSIQNSSPHRNISGLHNIFTSTEECGKLARIGVSSTDTRKIQFFGYVDTKKAYQIMRQHCHIGLLPWQKHWFHPYCSPNKVYEYALCGLWLITINDLKTVIDDFGSYCDTFENYKELHSLLKYYNNHPDEINKKRKQSMDFATRNFIWEKNEQQILDAYKAA